MAGCSPLTAWLRCTSRAEEGASEALGRMAKVSARNPWKCLDKDGFESTNSDSLHSFTLKRDVCDSVGLISSCSESLLKFWIVDQFFKFFQPCTDTKVCPLEFARMFASWPWIPSLQCSQCSQGIVGRPEFPADEELGVD